MHQVTLEGTVTDVKMKKSWALNILRLFAPIFPQTYLMSPQILGDYNDKREIIVSTLDGVKKISGKDHNSYIKAGDKVELLGTSDEGVTTYESIVLR